MGGASPEKHAGTSRKRPSEDENGNQAKRLRANETSNGDEQYDETYITLTNEVELSSTKVRNEGICIRDKYRCRNEVGSKSMSEVEEQIAKEDTLLGYHMYAAFKEALLRLLSDIECVLTGKTPQVKVIMVHGLPQIGKTTLSKCLGYYLALFAGNDEIVHVNGLRHSPQVDADGLTDDILMMLSQNYLIFDQVNTNSLNIKLLKLGLQRRPHLTSTNMPIVMFTSGHYPPTEDWLYAHEAGWLHLKLIQMRGDTELVDKLNAAKLEKTSPDAAVPNVVVLEVSTVFGHIVECLAQADNTGISASSDLRETVFPSSQVKYLESDAHCHILWLVWEKLLSRGLPNVEEFGEDYCKIAPSILSYLASWLSQLKDTNDKGIIALLNQMDVVGPKIHDAKNYSEFDLSSYEYIFLNKKSLHNLLKNSADMYAKLTPVERLVNVMKAHDALESEGSYANSGRGVLFEFLMKYICEAERYRSKNKFLFGMTQSESHVTFSEVQAYEEVADVHELCSLPLRLEACKGRKAKVFCALNLPGNAQFKGFDYACVETSCFENTVQVEEMQLFQVTVNAERKHKTQRLVMTDVLKQVKQELVKEKLIKKNDANAVVIPFFVEPSGGKSISLPCRNSNSTISVEVLALPLDRYR